MGTRDGIGLARLRVRATQAWRSARSRLANAESPLLLALLLWLCTLPLVLLLVFPFFGSDGAFLVAGLLLVGILLICLKICAPRRHRAFTDIVERGPKPLP